jgi:hypothetical protein
VIVRLGIAFSVVAQVGAVISFRPSEGAAKAAAGQKACNPLQAVGLNAEKKNRHSAEGELFSLDIPLLQDLSDNPPSSRCIDST